MAVEIAEGNIPAYTAADNNRFHRMRNEREWTNKGGSLIRIINTTSLLSSGFNSSEYTEGVEGMTGEV